jgi:hypothetical protein
VTASPVRKGSQLVALVDVPQGCNCMPLVLAGTGVVEPVATVGCVNMAAPEHSGSVAYTDSAGRMAGRMVVIASGRFQQPMHRKPRS